MWIKKHFDSNKIVLRWHTANYKPIGIALAISFLLHVFLAGSFKLNAPSKNHRQQAIQAQLVIKTSEVAAANQSAKPNPTELAQPQLPKPAPLKRKFEKFKIGPLAKSSKADEITSKSELSTPATEPNVESFGLPVKYKSYEYVETLFDIYTDKEPLLDGNTAGSAMMVYQALPNTNQYQITKNVHIKGVFALIIPDLFQTSEGIVTDLGLQPLHFRQRQGNDQEKALSAEFNWSALAINFHDGNRDETLGLTPSSQDVLSVMYQFMFVPTLQTMQLNVTDGQKIEMAEYQVLGEEAIKTKAGSFNTIRLLTMAATGQKKTELWLALDYQHVPVKIRETETSGKVFELLLTSLNTEKSASLH